jgi:hypothetical protein
MISRSLTLLTSEDPITPVYAGFGRNTEELKLKGCKFFP